MKRSVKTIIIAVTLAALMLPVNAFAGNTDVKWDVTFNEQGAMQSTFDSKEVNDAVKGLQPGDSVTFAVKEINANSQKTDWYLRNEVLSSLEESAKAAKERGGAYTYKLTYTNDQTGEEEVLFDSAEVGGENDTETGKEGLNQATSGLEKWLFLDTLGQNETGSVELFILLEGESQGNDYQDTMAKLELQFAVELPKEESSEPGKNEEKKESKTPTNNATTSKKNAVKTGDTSMPLMWFLIAGIAGVVLLVVAILSVKKRRAEALENTAGRRDIK